MNKYDEIVFLEQEIRQLTFQLNLRDQLIEKMVSLDKGLIYKEKSENEK